MAAVTTLEPQPEILPLGGARCWVHFDGWAGRVRVAAELLRETPTRYRVRLLARYLWGRGRRLTSRLTLYAPKSAVTFD